MGVLVAEAPSSGTLRVVGRCAADLGCFLIRVATGWWGEAEDAFCFLLFVCFCSGKCEECKVLVREW